MSKGIDFLFKKNKITLINGFGKLTKDKKIEVLKADGSIEFIEADKIIIATGARSKNLKGVEQDGEKIIGYREALSLKKLPESLVVIGSGAIGTELAYFYNSMGTDVTLIEYLPEIVPLEDEEVSKQLADHLKNLE
jgi:dihydrolipoamide dehydrogenase